MSEAGVRSSIGDDYQDSLAVWWLSRMLSDETLMEVEVESTSLVNDERVRVDDVIIRMQDGRTIFCQCKVNHPKRGTWDVAALEDDLRKAWGHWKRVPEGNIHFYSSGPFGDLQHLQERADRMPDTAAFLHEMPKNIFAEYSKFLQIIAQSQFASDEIYSFFRHVHFFVKADRDLHTEAQSYLYHHVTQKQMALTLLKGEVRRVTCRRLTIDSSEAQAKNHLISRQRLLDLLHTAGLRITPRCSKGDLTTYFARYSNRGRVWRRNIKEHHFVRPQQEELIQHVETEKSVLVVGPPGSGKTCILLELVEHLEKDTQRFCIFLQARDVEDVDVEEFQMAFLDALARMAEFLPVVLVVDSLDVLSTTVRRRFNAVITLMEQVRRIPQACVVAACRSFDLRYDPQLSALSWPQTLHLKELNFDAEVTPLLQANGVDPNLLSSDQKKFVCNPRMLQMFLDVAEKGAAPLVATAYNLADVYLDQIVMRHKLLGRPALVALQALSARMISEKRLSLPKRQVCIDDALLPHLLSEGILLETDTCNYAFSHQTLVDVLAAEYAQSNNQSLSQFMSSMPAVPFIRPTIRYFFFSLRNHDAMLFRRQVRSALVDASHAFHLKRLLAVSLAEITPQPDDWPLLHFLFVNDVALFTAFFEKAHPEIWFNFFQEHFLPEWQSKPDWLWLQRYTEWLRRWPQTDPALLIQLWTFLLSEASSNKESIAINISFAMDNFENWNQPGLQDVFTLLTQYINPEQHQFIGKPLSQWIDATNSHDDILWSFIISNVDIEKLHSFNIKLNCDEYIFYEKEFLTNRIKKSEDLLNMALSSLDEWSKKMGRVLADGFTRHNFLLQTSHGHRRMQLEPRHFNGLNILLNAIELACTAHAEQNSNWWKTRAQYLWDNAECTLRYMALCGLARNPQSNLPLVERILLHITDRSTNYFFEHELACLLGAASPFLDTEVSQKIQNEILSLHEDRMQLEDTQDVFVWRTRRDYLIEIPAPYRTPESAAAIVKAQKICGLPRRAPYIRARGGRVHPPFSYEKLIELSPPSLLKLLQYYGSENIENDWADVEDDHIIGGTSSVVHVLSDATSIDPHHFYQWSLTYWQEITPQFQAALLQGIADHARYRFGNLRKDNWVPQSTPTEETLFTSLLQLVNKIAWAESNSYSLKSALNACSWLVRTPTDLENLYPLLLWCCQSKDPEMEDNCNDLHGKGLNSIRGEAATAAFIIASHWLERNQGNLPEPLLSILYQLAEDPHPAVRGMVLQRLPTILHYSPELGWQLFHKAVSRGPSEIWEFAYYCLYYNYHKNFTIVKKYLARMKNTAMPGAAKQWGKIQTLAYLSDEIDKNTLIEGLIKINIEDAWKGSVAILVHNTNTPEIENKCLEGLERILEHAPKNKDILSTLRSIFYENGNRFCFPAVSFVEQLFSYSSKTPEPDHLGFYNFPKWILALSVHDCDSAIHAAELYFMHCNAHITTEDNEALIKLLTVLFREAEEREEMDNGNMLRQVLELQDTMLRKGISAMDDWFNEAERP